jgi:hypothetical protein
MLRINKADREVIREKIREGRIEETGRTLLTSSSKDERAGGYRGSEAYGSGQTGGQCPDSPGIDMSAGHRREDESEDERD